MSNLMSEKETKEFLQMLASAEEINPHNYGDDVETALQLWRDGWIETMLFLSGEYTNETIDEINGSEKAQAKHVQTVLSAARELVRVAKQENSIHRFFDANDPEKTTEYTLRLHELQVGLINAIRRGLVKKYGKEKGKMLTDGLLIAGFALIIGETIRFMELNNMK